LIELVLNPEIFL